MGESLNDGGKEEGGESVIGSPMDIEMDRSALEETESRMTILDIPS